MRIKTQAPLIFLLILTVFSAGILGYSLYEILMIRWATKSVEVSVRDVYVTLNGDQPRINFKVVLRNNVNTYLGLTYIGIDVYLDETRVTCIEMGYGNPVSLPLGVDKILEFSANIKKSPEKYSVRWRFKVYAIFATNLIQTSSISRWVPYEG